MAPEAHLSPGGAGNTHDTGDLLQPAHDGLQLLAVGYIHGQRDQSEAVGGGAGVERGYVDLGSGEDGGDIHQQIGPILGHHLQIGAVGFPCFAAPGDLDPAARLLRRTAGGVGVGAVLPVDRDA